MLMFVFVYARNTMYMYMYYFIKEIFSDRLPYQYFFSKNKIFFVKYLFNISLNIINVSPICTSRSKQLSS